MRRWIALGQRRATDVRPQNRLRLLFSANHLFFPANRGEAEARVQRKPCPPNVARKPAQNAGLAADDRRKRR